ncbi:MAG: glycerol kinase [Actinobacteria bacterium]|nr:glycerol kinase [Actinomycetota bacterium]
MTQPLVMALDAGTTGVRARLIRKDGTAVASAYREFPQYFPQPGWVEHDANEIWEAICAVIAEVTQHGSPVAIGITNQRETIVAWSRATSQPLHRAIVWQDRRTANHCESLGAHIDRVRTTTGLVLDPYFSGTKCAWLINEGGVPVSDDLAFGTIDSWLVWKLSGGKVHATDPSNASRTMLFDIGTMSWSEEMCALIGVPIEALPQVLPSSGMFAVTSGIEGLSDGTPISGIAGDQQAALFGQACFAPGQAKNTYGTGSFVLMNIGNHLPAPMNGMLTTVAWDLGAGPVYALEGSIFVTGAAVQWLRYGLQIIEKSSETEALALSVPDSGGLVFVPALTGLGSPWWDPDARGGVFGITRGTTRAHFARAAVESMVYQTRDVIEAMNTDLESSGRPTLVDLRVDGGASAMNSMLQMQSDQLGVSVLRPRDLETTSLGAAYLAGLAVGVWSSLDEITQNWHLDKRFDPGPAAPGYEQWLRALQRVRN